MNPQFCHKFHNGKFLVGKVQCYLKLQIQRCPCTDLLTSAGQIWLYFNCNIIDFACNDITALLLLQLLFFSLHLRHSDTSFNVHIIWWLGYSILECQEWKNQFNLTCHFWHYHLNSHGVKPHSTAQRINRTISYHKVVLRKCSQTFLGLDKQSTERIAWVFFLPLVGEV